MPPSADDPAAEVRRTAHSWASAITANEPTRIAAHMADDWTMISASGPSPRDHFLSLVASGRLTHSAMDILTEPRIRIHGDTAILTARITNTAHFDGRTYPADEWTTDIFVRQPDGRWLCVLTHITPAAD